jgi:hypothetical protein
MGTGAATSQLVELARWIAPHHLNPATIAGYWRTFTTHPARLLLLEEFLRPEWAATLATFLHRGTTYETRFALTPEQGIQPFARGVHVTSDEWQRADSARRFFVFDAATGFDVIDPVLPQYLDFLAAIAGGAFRELASSMTGVPVGAAGVEPHRMTAGQFIGLHTDARANRRLGVIIYLSPSWDERFGGVYRIRAHDGTDIRIVPQFNSMLLFDVAGHRDHEVTTVVADVERLSFNAWLLGADPCSTADRAAEVA